jgi:cytochrome c-type biogenesis protein CcsB
MPAPTALAQYSDALVYSAMAVYALAMVSYALEAALRSRTPAVRAAPALVTAGAPAGPGLSARPAAPVSDASSSPSRQEQRLGRVGVSLTILAFVLHLAAVLARAAAAGRVPWGNMYEFAVTGAVAATGAYLFFLRYQPVRDLGAWIVAVVLLTLGLSVTVLYTPAGDLVPALDSYWLVIHVIAAIICGGVFTVGAAAAVPYLMRLRADRRRAAGLSSSYSDRLPSAASLQRVVHVAHLFAFPLWTFAVIAGAIWAENAWGRYWGWDPKETWAFITWILYAAYLHAEATAGWRGKRATWFVLAGYGAFVFNFFGVNMWITGLHSYAGI